MNRSAGRILLIIPIVVLWAAAAGLQAGQQKGGIDATGPYDPVPNWFKPLHDGRIQCVSGVAAESPDRIYLVTEVEVAASQPAGGCTPERSKPSAHSHFILVVDGTGKVIEDWSQWNNLFGFPHTVRINPYDPEKHVWIINRDAHQVHEFTRDGKQLVMTLGEFNVPGTDARHFGLPADIAFLPDGSFFVADGYFNSRVVKFDKNGKYQLAWGAFGSGPGQFRVPHGVAIDGQRRVYVADRDNNRVQIFDEDGHYLDEWRNIRGAVAHVMATRDQAVWVLTLTTGRLLKYDLAGHLLTYWGTESRDRPFPGSFSGPHQFTVDSAGNLYVADFRNQVLKFVPKPGADPSRLIGQPY
jgi:DNA-binding beta-propeller fold protein YncE